MRRLLAVVLILTAACGSSSTTTPVTVASTYTLQTMNGAPLPYVVSQTGPVKTEIVDDTITLDGNGGYTRAGHSRQTVNGQATVSATSDSGFYTLTGTAIILSSAAGNPSSGTLSGNTLTITVSGVTAVYTT